LARKPTRNPGNKPTPKPATEKKIGCERTTQRRWNGTIPSFFTVGQTKLKRGGHSSLYDEDKQVPGER